MIIINTLDELKNKTIEEKRRMYIPAPVRAFMPVVDNKEPLVRLDTFFSSLNVRVVLASVWKKEQLQYLYLREGVAKKLVRVTHTFNDSYFLKITDALRPLTLQRILFEEICGKLRRSENIIDENELRKRARRFVADPDIGIPPHSTGGVLDLTLVDKDGHELDMGTTVDALSDKAETFHPEITGEQLENRLLLLHAMEKEGFVNLASEWWHYSFGDQYWAAFRGEPHAIYSSIEDIPYDN